MNKTIILLSLIPAILWIFYFYRQDKYEKEPLKLLLITFFLGCLSVIPALIIELIFQGQINYHIPFGPVRIAIGMMMVGLTEEICKFYAVKSYVYKNEEFNEPVDGIVYCVTAALGFAFVENIAYMLNAQQLGGLVGAYTLGVMRAIFSMFGHATFGVIMGSYLGRARFDKDREGILIVKGIFLASVVHALYNYTVSINKEGLSAFLVLIAFFLVWRNLNRVTVDAAVDESPFKPADETYKPKKWHWGMINTLTVLMIISVIALAMYNFDKPRFYSHEKTPFTLHHHNFWGVAPSADHTAVRLIGPPYRGSVPEARVYYRKSEGIAIDEIVSRNFESIEKERPGLEKISADTIKISENDAIRVIARWKYANKQSREIPMMTHMIVANMNENLVVFVFDAGEASFDETKDQFDEIMNSLKIRER